MKIFKKLFDGGIPTAKEQSKDKVLLAESDEKDAGLFTSVLTSAGFEVHRARSCDEAYNMIADVSNYKAIVADFYLSDGTAVEIVRYAKQVNADTIAIVIANEVVESMLLEAMNAGASYCIPKAEGHQHLAQLIKLGHEQHIGVKTATGSLAANQQQQAPAVARQSSGHLQYRGQISSTTAPRLLRAFYQQQASGALHIFRNNEQTSLYFADGAIVFAGSSTAENRFGEMLVKSGRISRDDFETACKLMASSGLRFGAALTTLGIIKLEDLKPLVVQHVLRLIFSTFEWDTGEFVFEPGVKLDNEVMLSLSTADVIFAGIRHLRDPDLVDRWLGDCDRVLIPTSDPFSLFQALTLRPDENMVLEKFNRPMSVNQVRAIEGLNPEVVSRTLCGLIETGMLVPFETVDEHLISEASKFSEFFDSLPLPLDFDARAAAEFCYEVETTLRHFRKADHYAVLGISRSAAVQDITSAFRNLARRFHPDRHAQLAGYHLNLKADLKAIFERLAEAYYTLTDPERRNSYDQTLNRESGSLRPVSAPLGNIPVNPLANPLANNPLANLRFAPPPSQKGRPSLQATKPLPPIVPGLPGSDEYQIALIHYASRQFDEARKALLRAIEADPDNPEYRVAFARSLSKMPIYIRQAEDAYLKAIELSPNNADYYAELGLLYQQFSQIAQARKMLQRALELDPNNPIALRAKI